MASDTTRELTEKIKQRMAEYASSKDPAQLASHPPNDINQAIAEWERLMTKRISLASQNSDDDSEVESFSAACLKPKRPILSGSIALPLPEIEPEPAECYCAAAAR